MTANDESCPGCGVRTDRLAMAANLGVCPSCGRHERLEPRQRIAYLVDEGSFEEIHGGLLSLNPLEMAGYEDKIGEAMAKADMSEAVVTGRARIEGMPCVLAVMSFKFMGGSMGSVVGERVHRALVLAAAERVPAIVYATSGGARMQEGIFSLMQMAKTSAACAVLEEEGVPYFVVLCDPTTGGVTASFAMLGDVTLAEPGALVGFAGPRVIEGTIRQKLPEGFQRSEFQLEKGFVDIIAPRSEQRRVLSFLMRTHGLPARKRGAPAEGGAGQE